MTDLPLAGLAVSAWQSIPAPPRWMLTASYLLLTGSGAAALVWPPPSVSAAAGGLVLTWAAFLMSGGGLSAAGQITDRWLGEFVGLPVLVTALTLFGIVSMVTATTTRSSATAGGLLLLGLSIFFAARWVQVWGVRRLALAAIDARRSRKTGGE